MGVIMGTTIFNASDPTVNSATLYSDEDMSNFLKDITDPQQRADVEGILKEFSILGQAMDRGIRPPSVPEIPVRGKLTVEG